MLKLSFPRLFALEENKVISVADKLHSSISSSFRRPVRGGEEAQQLDQLSVILDSVSLSNMDDRWYWDLNGDGVFLVKDVRSLLDEVFLPKMDAPTRWIKCIPIKVNVFVWKLSLDRLPTRSNLLSRNILVSDVACPLCDHELEDSSHLFFGCPIAKDVQKLVCRWWNLDVQPYESYDGWLSWFKSIRFRSKTKDVLEGVFYVSWWSIWYFRNQLLFSDSIPRKDAIFDDIILRSFNWCVARSSTVLNWVAKKVTTTYAFVPFNDSTNCHVLGTHVVYGSFGEATPSSKHAGYGHYEGKWVARQIGKHLIRSMFLTDHATDMGGPMYDPPVARATHDYVKRLIRNRASDEIVKEDMKLRPFKVVAGNDDKPKIVVTYKEENRELSVKEFLTKDAGAVAGLEVVRMINEPITTEIAYALDKRVGVDDKMNVLVFDLGGDTFDVSMMITDEKGNHRG
ncbi:RNA-directed DNA polymerase, eukaryota [Tanacetum coccineum]